MHLILNTNTADMLDAVESQSDQYGGFFCVLHGKITASYSNVSSRILTFDNNISYVSMYNNISSGRHDGNPNAS